MVVILEDDKRVNERLSERCEQTALASAAPYTRRVIFGRLPGALKLSTVDL